MTALTWCLAGGWLLSLVVAAWWLRRIRRDTRALRNFAAAVVDEQPPPALPDGPLGEVQAAVLRALTHQNQKLDAAIAEQRRLELVLGGMVEGVLVIDDAGTVLLSNRRAEELLDMPPGQNSGRPLIELNRHPDLQRLVRWAVGERRSDAPAALEIDLDGVGSHVLEVTATPFAAGPGTRPTFILVFHDVSPMKRLERMRRDFVANVSHELRTPLAAIAGYTETLLDGALDDAERARHFLGIIDRHTERLGRLVNDLLTLSDLELGRAALRKGAVSASDIVDSTFEVVQGKATQSGVTLRMDIDPDTPLLDADQDRLEQALVNLVDNAIKYTPQGGRVTVRARPVGADGLPEPLRRADAPRFVELRVEDTGVGVPPEDLPRLTERFYRVDKARSRELGGTGLGLAIVKHIAQAHGGGLDIASTLGRGTTVRLLIPVHDTRREDLARSA
jgi:two-component system phosphate regulon sensor histidine kinase PhoR